MTFVAITQRVTESNEYVERRDALDQRWISFMVACDLTPVLMPNNPDVAYRTFVETGCQGMVLTGGNSLIACGGDALERDQTEIHLLNHCETYNLPVIGVCRGMQLFQSLSGLQLYEVAGQVQDRQSIVINNRLQEVNSFHHWGSVECSQDWSVWAKGDSGLVKGIRHLSKPWVGLMWHPERLDPFRHEDMQLFQRHFRDDSL